MKAGYVRVSTDIKTQDMSVERQIYRLKKLNCDQIFVDRLTGTTADRPKYQELVRLIKLGEVTEVIVAAMDRLNRDPEERRFFDRLCDQCGVYITYTDQMHLSTSDVRDPWVEEQRDIAAFEAYRESRRTSRRIKESYKHAEETGRPIARHNPFGYRVRNHRYEIDLILPDLSNVIGYLNDQPLASGELAKALVNSYFQQDTMGQALQHWKETYIRHLVPVNEKETKRLLNYSHHSLRTLLHNPTLRGYTAYGVTKRIYTGDRLDKKVEIRLPEHEWRVQLTHPDQCILTDSQYEEIQKRCLDNKHMGYSYYRTKNDPDYQPTLASLLRCTKCKSKYYCESCKHQLKSGLHIYRYYKCSGRRNKYCTEPKIKEADLLNQLVSLIVTKADELLKMLNDQPLTETDAVQLERLRLKLEEAKRDYAEFKMPGYKQIQLNLQKQITQIEDNRAIQKQQVQDNAKRLAVVTNPDYWHSLSHEQLNRYLRGCIQECLVENGKVTDLILSL